MWILIHLLLNDCRCGDGEVEIGDNFTKPREAEKEMAHHLPRRSLSSIYYSHVPWASSFLKYHPSKASHELC